MSLLRLFLRRKKVSVYEDHTAAVASFLSFGVLFSALWSSHGRSLKSYFLPLMRRLISGIPPDYCVELRFMYLMGRTWSHVPYLTPLLHAVFFTSVMISLKPEVPPVPHCLLVVPWIHGAA